MNTIDVRCIGENSIQNFYFGPYELHSIQYGAETSFAELMSSKKFLKGKSTVKINELHLHHFDKYPLFLNFEAHKVRCT